MQHTHEGNIGNRCNDHISDNMNKIVAAFAVDAYHSAIDQVQLVGRLLHLWHRSLCHSFVRSVRESSFVNGD
ncbi:MAG TPA: hypothetical protein PKM63_18440 [Panacibacter sp.]|nr:hypothetical protein [Panacibacter sp.]HNP46280.1 hypothetical protein [Panacibacter sp.]